MKTVEKIENKMPIIKKRKRVAGYARVSMETERLHHSLSSQISYYSDLIQSNPEWEYAGVYADEAVSGTSTKRPEFQRMLDDCEEGKIDIILTKSISRFARNTVDLLNVVRHLKELGIEVRFEKENINSLSGDGELMLTLLASFAQEESISISNNVKWGIRKRMEEGHPHGHVQVYGYRWEGDQLVIVPEEAAVVKRIFQNFLDGKSRLETEREFAAEGITTRNGKRWVDSNIKVVLTNVTYTGNLLLQKEYISDPIEKKRKKNHGELPQYWVENTHPAIIDKATFGYVQEEMARRKELGFLANKSINTTCFSGKIKCSCCGKSYTHCFRNPRTPHGKVLDFWTCNTNKSGGGGCPIGGTIPHQKLIDACTDVLDLSEFDEDAFLEQVDIILVPKRYQLEFHLKDGTIATRDCPATGHQDCWTDEYRARISEYRRTHVTYRSDFTVFTKRIVCAECSCNFRRHTRFNSEGTPMSHWRCATPGNPCGTPSLREDALKQLTAEVLGIDEFDEAIFVERISTIEVNSDAELIFHFMDGNTITRKWEKPQRIMPPWTEERRAKYMKSINDGKRCKKDGKAGNDNPGNAEPIHGSTD